METSHAVLLLPLLRMVNVIEWTGSFAIKIILNWLVNLTFHNDYSIFIIPPLSEFKNLSAHVIMKTKPRNVSVSVRPWVLSPVPHPYPHPMSMIWHIHFSGKQTVFISRLCLPADCHCKWGGLDWFRTPFSPTPWPVPSEPRKPHFNCKSFVKLEWKFPPTWT
jgi:hypothetical protein